MDHSLDPAWKLETITPAVAKMYLELNTKNYRRLNEKLVRRYAKTMLEGRWREAHPQGIAFDRSGAVGDGQHRLAAIVQSGKTITAWVLRGCDPKVFLESDTGRRRTEGDRLHQLGFRSDVDPRTAASVAGHMLRGLTQRDHGASISDYALAHEALIASFLLELAPARPRRSEVVAAFCKGTFEHEETRVLACAKRYATLDFLGADDPLKLLHLRLVEGTSARLVRDGTPIYAYAVTAVRAAAEGRGLQRLRAAEVDFVARPVPIRPRTNGTHPRFVVPAPDMRGESCA